MATYEPTTDIERFTEWLDTTPHYTWEIVETAARTYSLNPQQGAIRLGTSIGGMCVSLHIMSGYPVDVIAQFVRDFAADNYEYGERID
jgi:hypothetical protein